MKRILLSLLLAALYFPLLMAQQIISLAGGWDFHQGELPLDKECAPQASGYDDFVLLPGSMLTNDKGDPVSVDTQWTGSLYDSSYYFNPYMEKYRTEGQMKLPFFLTPKYHYVGAAWYQRKVYVPKTWRRQRIMLYLERPHIETTVYVNGKEVGHQMSLSTPHVYDVSSEVKAGENNTIAIRVYNGIENVCVGQDSHSVTDQTQGNWNGIVGRMELQARPRRINIRQVRVYPDVAHAKARVVVDLENHVNELLGDVHIMQVREYGVVYELKRVGAPDSLPPIVSAKNNWTALEGNRVEFTIHMAGNMHVWDEFTPVVYQLTVYAGDDSYETTFGFRDISIEGRQMYINGRPLYLRGTVENCCFPETGYPPTDEDEWLRIFKKCKDFGLNHIRFHSYCPPEAAFAAADKVGMYLQPEGPSWPNHGVKLHRGMAIDEYLMDESRRIVDTYGNHPSFVMMAAGNEPAGDWVSYCNYWVEGMHQYDSTRVYCGASVGGGWAWDNGSEYHVKGGARGLDWDRHAPSSDDDYYSQIEFPRNYKSEVPNRSPIIAHEQGQWCTFPDFKEITQYTGAYKARNFEIFRDMLRDGGMETMAEKFLMASGELQKLCYKYEMERNFRTKDYTGFQLLGLNDYSGQGTALVGPLNVFWKEKGYANARSWREFCSSMVVLARFPKFVYSNRDTLTVPVEMMNAFWGNLKNCVTTYEVWQDDSLQLIADTLSVSNVPVGKNNQLGVIRMPLDSISRPSKMSLIVGNVVRNQWNFWVYPEPAPISSPREGDLDGSGLVYETDTLDDNALEVLRQGGNVLLTAAGRVALGSDVKQSYLPVFWNTSWFKMRPPHTTGAYIDTSHPLFSHDFPTDSWSNLNWWELLNKAQVMNLRELPASYQPPIQPIDTWHVSRKLGMLIEARVLNGKLLMTTMDISSDLEHRLVARQMRHAITSYMQSADFQPSLTLQPDVVRHFFTEQAPAVNMFTNDSPDELKPKLK